MHIEELTSILDACWQVCQQYQFELDTTILLDKSIHRDQLNDLG